MLEAISLRTPERKRISADEAFSKVFGKNDWGQLQRIDGWACPECSEPVFLKPPQERTAKGYSFVVRAHFCHYSTKAAAQCALYKAASHKSGQSQLEAFHRDRKQSLAKFLSSAVQESSYIAELLKGEEEFLRQAVRELNAKQPSLCSPDPASIINESDQFNAVQTHKRLQGLDNFLAGIFTIGLEGKRYPFRGRDSSRRTSALLNP